jgi:type IV pilus assembly protein PilM
VKNFLYRLLPRKNHFVGIDIGSHEIKMAAVKATKSGLQIAALNRCPSPSGLASGEFDEEDLVQALRHLVGPDTVEAITCLEGEQAACRVLRLPLMNDQELAETAAVEMEKHLPLPEDQLINRYVRLDDPDPDDHNQRILLISVPNATVCRYFSIFSRAGLVLTAVDMQSLSLWRLLGRREPDTIALLDLGARFSQLVIGRDGVIFFTRVLPTGGELLTLSIRDSCGVSYENAGLLKEAADLSKAASGNIDLKADAPLRQGLAEIVREVGRSLEFFRKQEGFPVGKLIITGGTARLRGLAQYLQGRLGLPVEVAKTSLGDLDPGNADRLTIDPVFAVALGLALREVAGSDS